MDEQHTRRKRLGRRLGVAALALFLLVAMCGVAEGALRHRLGPAWSVNLDLHRVQVIVGTSEFAHCGPPTPGWCSFSGPPPKTFVVLLIQRQQTAAGDSTSKRYIFMYPQWH